jgi:hypothetical protein
MNWEINLEKWILRIETDNRISNIDLDIFVVLGVLLIVSIIYTILLIRARKQATDESLWVNTEAVLTGRQNVRRKRGYGGNKYSAITISIIVYEIEYWADGFKYLNYVEFVPSEEKGTIIPIQYFKSKPSRFREVVEDDEE